MGRFVLFLKTSARPRHHLPQNGRHRLYIVRETIAGFGGNIQVASTLGEGTEFTIHLPIAEEKASDE
uniref:Histidine kinase n=1 Tax=Candidatus Kentrum sp. FW TaxID=2126338 RepID=A0A450TID1_9GAMM|nr:MAG: hypothetical protein BECKFW1821A_GA0114235_10937 [Candidatus Kentron sp. FW]VFJ67034.1 MAG: hypothetical protein BECKFW1821B_GA0114236_11255 [Candidatus Kentron sp. FW]